MNFKVTHIKDKIPFFVVKIDHLLRVLDDYHVFDDIVITYLLTLNIETAFFRQTI
jgi:hypothetical protein